jgi:hypothetical protein
MAAVSLAVSGSAVSLPLASSAAQAQPVSLVDARLSSDLSRVLEEHLLQEPARGRRSEARLLRRRTPPVSILRRTP